MRKLILSSRSRRRRRRILITYLPFHRCF